VDAEKVLDIVLREMAAIGAGWRADWKGFDGRTLRHQLNNLANWARFALHSSDDDLDCTEGTEFLEDQRDW
jgi:hypothetical protein